MSEALDRAATLPGYVRVGGQLSESTLDTYARWWGRYKAWCRQARLRHLPTTSDTLASYAEYLAGRGVAVSTVHVAITAIRWAHRLAGVETPDRLPSWYVLRPYHATGTGSQNRPLPRPACRSDLAALAMSVTHETAAGAQDVLLALTAYCWGMGEEQAVKLTIGALPTAGLCPQWHPGRVVGLVCPRCAVSRWQGRLAAVGVRSGPMFRAIDRHDHIAGGDRYAGPPGIQVQPGWVRTRLRKLFAAADLLEDMPRPMVSLRVGGAIEVWRAGGSAQEVATRSGYPVGSVVLARYLSAAGPDIPGDLG